MGLYKWKHVSHDVKLAKRFIDKRAEGLLPSAKTPFKSLNDLTLDGLAFGEIVSIAGGSGSGKSTFVDALKYYILSNDPNIINLNLQLDMTTKQEVLRQLSKRTGFSVGKLSSKKDHLLTEEDKEIINRELEEIGKYNIFNIEISPTVDELSEIIDEFIVAHEFKDETGVAQKKLLITCDYVSLLKGKRGNDRKQIIDDFYEMIVQKKKMLEQEEIPALFIILSQLNRTLFDANRIKDPTLHLLTEADIYGSSSLFNGSDLVLGVVNPSKVRGLEYFTQYKKPIKTLMGNPCVYVQIMKSRSCESNLVLDLYADFKRNLMFEMPT